MKVCVFDDDRVGVIRDDRVLDVTSQVDAKGADPLLSVLGSLHSDPSILERACRDAGSVPLVEARMRPPIRRPGKVVAAPINYADHQREMSQAFHVSGLGVFLKAPSSIIGPGDDICLPYVDRRFDQEGELAVVVGRTARHVPRRECMDHVFGFTCLLDITMRGGEDRSTRKSFDTFTPLGPAIVTADEAGDPGTFGLRCWVNDQLRQDASTEDLIWGVAELVQYASSVMTLHPGDIIATGTPAGVGALSEGDRVRLEIDRIGCLEVGVSARGAIHCPTSGAGHGPVPPAS